MQGSWHLAAKLRCSCFTKLDQVPGFSANECKCVGSGTQTENQVWVEDMMPIVRDFNSLLLSLPNLELIAACPDKKG